MKSLNLLLISSLLIVTTGCTKSIDVVSHIDMQKSFKVGLNDGDRTSLSLVDVNSEKYAQIVNWCRNNSEGWESNPASFNGDIWVNQEGFQLRYFRKAHFVVFSFNSKNRETKQFSKVVPPGELDFLVK